MNDKSLNWLIGERTICVVGDASSTEVIVDALRPLPLKVLSLSEQTAMVVIQAAVPDLVIFSGRLQTWGEQLLTEPKTSHIGQLYVVEEGEEAAVLPLVMAHPHCDLIRTSFTADELRLRIHKVLGTLQPINRPNLAEQFPLFDAVDGGILVFDETGRIIEANRRACELYGRSYEELTQLYVGSFSAEEGDHVREEALRRIMLAKTNGPQQFEWRSKRGDGQLIWIDVRISYVALAGQSRYVALVQDMTSQKHLMEMLQETYAHYGALVEHMYEGVIILQDALIKIDNHGLSGMLGYTVDEVQGSDFAKYVAPAFQEEVTALYGRFVNGGEVPYFNEVQLIHRDGHLVDVEVTGAHTEYEGRPAVMAVVRNISYQKVAEQALLASEDKFAKAFHASPDANVIATWPEGVVLDVNHEFEQVTGYKREEVIHQAGFNFYAPNERYAILNTLKEKSQWRDIEFVSQRKNGEAYPAVLAFDFLEIDGQTCTIEVVRDLSVQKEAEEALRLSEEKFSKAFFFSPDSVTISTLDDGIILEANQGFKNTFGYEPSDVIGQSVKDIDLITAEERRPVIDQLLRDGFIHNLKVASRHKLGHELVTNVSMELMEFAGEQCIVTIVRDITEQERMIEALRASEEKFANIFQFSPNALSITNLETGKFVEVNEGFERISGYTRDEAVGLSVGEIGLYAEDWQRLEARDLFQKSGRLNDYEFVAKQRSGQTIFCAISARLIEIGGIPCALVLVRDITEAKLSQEEIRRSEALLRETQARAKLGSWSLDLESGALYWSDVLYDLFDMPLSKALTYDDYAAQVAPEDLPVVEAIMSEAFRSGFDNFSYEHRVVTAEGTERYVWIHSYLDRDDTGRVVRVHGTAQDISDRRLTEEALFRSEEMAQAFQSKLRALHEVTIRLSSEESIDTFFRLAVLLGQEQLGFERLELFLFDDDQTHLYGTYGADETGRVCDQSGFHDLIVNYPALQELLNDNIRVREWDQANQRYQGEIVGMGWVALATLWDGDQGIGFISVDNHLTGDAPRPFAKDLLMLYGNALGHLLTQKRAELAVDRYVKQLQLLQQIDRAILRADSPAAMAQSVLEPLNEILDCHFIDIARYNAEQNVIYSLANTLNQPLDSDQFGSIDSATVTLLEKGDPIEFEDISGREKPAGVMAFWEKNGVRSMVVMPMMDDQLLGILYIGSDSPNRMSNKQKSIVKQVATQLAIALRQNVLNNRIENYANRLEHLVEIRTNQLAAKAQELEAFTYSVSHDLRAPLRAMDGFSRTLVNNYGTDLPDKAQHYLTRIQYNAQKMGRLIDDLLKLSRLGRQEMQFKELDGGRLVQSVIDELAANHQLEGAEITVQSLPSFYGDDTLLKQVWFNLISNAIKYTQKGQRPEIEIGSLQQAEQTVYYIQDNGIGFDMIYVDKLFGVFQRLHNVADYDGTGIGLATVQRIIHRHGGRIWAEAEVNNGAIFYFTLEEQPKETMQSNAE